MKHLKFFIIFIVILTVLNACIETSNEGKTPADTSAGKTTGSVTAASAMPGSDTLTPETIYGIQPADLVNNELSKKFFSALVKAYKSTLKWPDNESFGRAEYPFSLFAIEPFEGGALLFAGYTADSHPCLYYMEGNEVLAQITEAEYFSLNYTVFKNHTISYGIMLQSFNGPDSVKVIGSFANGEVVERGSANQRGYILVASGQTWLSSIKFFDKYGNITEDERSGEIGWNQRYYHWKGKRTEIWNVQRYTQLLEKPKHEYNNNNNLMIRFSNNDSEHEMNFFVDDPQAGWQYLWRGHNNLWNQCSGKNLEISVNNLPENAQIYWVDIEKDDGSGNNISGLLVKGSLQPPKDPGSYCLIIRTGNLLYTMFVVVEQQTK